MNRGGLKDHLGLVLTVLVAGVGTAIVAGNGVTAVVISVGGLLLIAGLILKRQSSDGSAERPKREAGSPLTFDFAWRLNGPADQKAVETALARTGLKVDRGASSSSAVVFHGGSQLHTRLFGGYFVSPGRLPVRVELGMPGAQANDREVTLRVRDRLGVALRDGALEKRYAQAAEEIERAVEASLDGAIAGSRGA